MTAQTALFLSGMFHVVLLFSHGSYIAFANGIVWGTGRRDQPVNVSDLGRRFDRIIANNIESMVAFVPVISASIFWEVQNEITATAGSVYLVTRVAFSAVYLANIPFIRTFFWFVGQGAIASIGWAVLVTLN
jgi:uncharacterized MAPEG superfamily protein